MKRETKITLGSIGLWIIGMIALRHIGIMTGCIYPMFGTATPTYTYDPDFHKFLF